MSAPARPLVIGLGSPHGDDQAGWAVVDRLRRRGDTNIVQARDGVELLMALDGQRDAIVIDASAPCGAPGRVRVFHWPSPELIHVPLLSTHGLGLVEALRMAEALERLPPRVSVIALESATTAPGAPLSAALERAIDDLVDRLIMGECEEENGRVAGGMPTSSSACSQTLDAEEHAHEDVGMPPG